MPLIFTKRFFGYFSTQFLGAFNDNLFKQSIVFMVSFKLSQSLPKETADFYVSLGAGLFILPFILFSSWAGTWADLSGKSRVILRTKQLEILIMLLGATAYWFLDPLEPETALHFLLAILFLMGTQSALFGPSKYGILPEIIKNSELIDGNGWLEMGTFVSILIGSYLGGWLVEWFGDEPHLMGFFFITIALLGFLSSLLIPKTTPADPEKTFNLNFPLQVFREVRQLIKTPLLFRSVLSISFFWFAGALFLQILPGLGLKIQASSIQTNFMMVIFSIGIGTGSMLCDRLSRSRVEMGLVLFGAVGLSLFSLDLGFFAPRAISEWAELSRIFIDLFGIGCFGGFYIVPLNALIQQRTGSKERASVMALNNILNALFMVLSTLFVIFTRTVLGVGEPVLFIIVGFLTIGVIFLTAMIQREFFSRFCFWSFTRFRFKLISGEIKNLLRDQPLLLILDRPSYLSMILLQMSMERQIRFYHPLKEPNSSFYRLILKLSNQFFPLTKANQPDSSVMDQLLKSGETLCVVSDETKGFMEKINALSAKGNDPYRDLRTLEVRFTETGQGFFRNIIIDFHDVTN